MQKILGGKGRAFKRGGGEHPPAIEVFTDGRYFTVTGWRLGNAELRTIPVADFRWLVEEAGPSFAGKPKSDGRDESRSAGAEAGATVDNAEITKFIAALRAAGADTIKDEDGLPTVLRISLDAALVVNGALKERWAGRMDGLAKENDRSALDFSLAALLKLESFSHLNAGLILCACIHAKANTDQWEPTARLRHVARCVLRSDEPGPQEEWLPKGYRLNSSGIWYHSGELKTPPVFVCGEFTPVAGTSDENGKRTAPCWNGPSPVGACNDGPCQIACCTTAATRSRPKLADAGLTCGTGQAAHERLKDLIFQIKPPKHIRSVARCGWHRIDDDDVYVLPSGEVFGKRR